MEPPVASFALMAYGQAAEIAEVGYRYAMKEIEQWDRANGLLTPRCGPGTHDARGQPAAVR
jgi:hypothetical protein